MRERNAVCGQNEAKQGVLAKSKLCGKRLQQNASVVGSTLVL